MARLNCVTVLAPAKLNLALDVVGLLPSGYHDLDMTMQAITLYERVVLRRSPYLNLRLPGRLRLGVLLRRSTTRSYRVMACMVISRL